MIRCRGKFEFQRQALHLLVLVLRAFLKEARPFLKISSSIFQWRQMRCGWPVATHVGMWQPFCKDLLMNNVRPEERCGLSWGTCGWCKNRNEGQEDRGDVGGRGGASARPQLQPPGHSGAGSMRLLKSTHDRDQQRHRSQEWQTDRARSLSSAQRRPRLVEGSGGHAQALGGSSRACALPPVDPLPGHERGASVLLDGAEL